MKDTYLSRFTPSSMEPEALEALFVQRAGLARQLMQLINESALSDSKHHTLLVGPRGIGKSHVVSLLYHRVRRATNLNDCLRIAWLREEEWGVGSFLDLLIRVLQALSMEYRDPALKDRIRALYDSPHRLAERAASDLLKDYLDNRTLLLIIENLDELFKGLSEDGQMRLRAYIQENPFLTILATTPSLFAGVSFQTSPFYGFFRIRHLEGLTFDEAVQLLVKIAKLQRDNKLANFIQSPTGRARVRAVHHLAGGNHRVYVVFSQFLTRTTLDELVVPFFRTLDDMTPYYQSRMSYLSTQQQKIIALLCDYRHALTVKEISQRCFITHQTASGQLKILKQIGYVHSNAVGRESYYELSEPFMRLTIELKKHRIEPIRLFIDFLRLWYSRAELEKRLTVLHPEAKFEREYVLHALETGEGGADDPLVTVCSKDCSSYLEKGQFGRALQAAEELVAIRGDADDYYELGHCLGHLGKWEEALAAHDQGLKVNPDHVRSLANRGGALLNLRRFDEAVEAYDRAIELGFKNNRLWGNRGFALIGLQRYEEAITSLDEALKIDAEEPRYWFDMGVALSELERLEEAVVAWDRAIDLNPESSAAFLNRAIALSKLHRVEGVIKDLDKAVELGGGGPHAWDVWYNRGVILGRIGRREDALESLRQAIQHSSKQGPALLDTGAALSHLNAEDEALALFEKAVTYSPLDAHAWLHKGGALFNLHRYEEALSAFEKVIELGDRSAAALFNRAGALIALGRWDEAKADLDVAVRLSISEGIDINAEEDIVRLLFIQNLDRLDLESRIKDLVDLYQRHSLLAKLGQGLVSNIALFVSRKEDWKAVMTWFKAWQVIGRGLPELKLPLRLVDVSLRYSHKNDPKVLLELPMELRSLLAPILEGN